MRRPSRCRAHGYEAACWWAAAPLITELGGDPAEVCRLAGVSPAIFDDPDMPVASAGVVVFLAQAAKSCDCPTFGLRLAGRQDLSVLGPLWLLMRSADTVGQLIADLSRYYVIHTRGSTIVALPAGDGSVFVTYHLAKQSPIDDRQVIELGMAMFCNEMRSHAEPDWEPASVQFCHRAPRRSRPASALLRPDAVVRPGPQRGAHPGRAAGPAAGRRR